MGKRGPTSGCTPEHCRLARKFCILGATNEQLAEFFDVGLSTIGHWLAHNPDFRKAVTDGRLVADADVAESLHGRAVGYDRKVEKIVATAEGPEVMSYTRHYEADTAACIFWLRNRRRDQWREKIEHEHHVSPDMLGLLEAAGERARNVRRR